jgi:serine/threonine-protein kinase PknK
VSATLAEVAQQQGDLSSARSYAAHALRYIREHGFVLWAASCLQVLAWVANQTGEYLRAARLLGASATEAERHGIIGFEAYPEREAAQASTWAVLGAEAWTAAYTAGRGLSLQEAIMEALGNGEF